MTMSHVRAEFNDVVGVDCAELPASLRNLNISGLALDSRQVSSGDVFIARQGDRDHGLAFAQQAQNNGAVAIISDCEPSTEPALPTWVCGDVTARLPEWLQRMYPCAQTLPNVAVTGTNGKSSTTHYMAQLLSHLTHKPVGLLGTVGNGLLSQLQTSLNTTVDIASVYRYLQTMSDQGALACALEVSSHGMVQQRVAGLAFDVVVFTNLTQDHLDYHASMDEYFAAKQSLFMQNAQATALINIDDEYGVRLYEQLNADAARTVISYGCAPSADIRYDNIKTTTSGLQAHVRSPWGDGMLSIPLLGEFNIANTVAALGACMVLSQNQTMTESITFADALHTCAHLHAVDGRMTVYKKPCAPTVVIDFAHTPAALNGVLGALKPSAKQLITVFGCGGERDKSKRPLMAQAVNQHSDIVWLTDDNPRSENPDHIWQDVLSCKGTDHFCCEHDRAVAIQNALSQSSEGDIVLLAGKGHEQYQHIGDHKLPYSDESVVLAQGYQRLTGGAHAA